jgi:hypothetical protein
LLCCSFVRGVGFRRAELHVYRKVKSNMINCNICGRTLPEHASYCDSCGRSVPTGGPRTEGEAATENLPVAEPAGRGGARGFFERGYWIPWLAGLLSFFTGQEIGEYFCYLVAYEALSRAARGPIDSSPHLAALVQCRRDGSPVGGFVGGFIALGAAWLTVRSGRRWLALPFGLLAGAIAAAVGGYLEGSP